MIAFTLALAFGWALHHPAPTILTLGIAAALAVLALAAWYADRPEHPKGRHVLADPDAETITVIHQMHDELHHEDPFSAAYLTAPLAGDFTSWEGAPTRPRRAEGTPDQTGLSGGQGSASTGALALAPAPEDVPSRAVAPVPAGDDPAAAVERTGPLPPPPGPDDDQLDDPALDEYGLPPMSPLLAAALQEAGDAARWPHLVPGSGYSDWHWAGDDTLTSMRAIRDDAEAGVL